jgi:hypothetical protein
VYIGVFRNKKISLVVIKLNCKLALVTMGLVILWNSMLLNSMFLLIAVDKTFEKAAIWLRFLKERPDCVVPL